MVLLQANSIMLFNQFAAGDIFLMTESFEISAVFPDVSAEQIYRSWLNSKAHSSFTGSPAQIDGRIGGMFTAWDGYISGRTLEMEPYRRILQAWRTTEFPEDSPDSRLEIIIEEAKGGTKITLRHTEIPAGQGDNYREGWEEYYFLPMVGFFSA
jgi:activator of HSP90 ATPase